MGILQNWVGIAVTVAFALTLTAFLARAASVLPQHILQGAAEPHPRHHFRRKALLALSPFCALACLWAFNPGKLVLAAIVYVSVLLVLAWIDAETGLLPDLLTLPLLWLGLLVNLSSGFISLQDAVLGAVAGYTTLWCVYWGFRLATGREGLGQGDLKLLAALGAWLGWAVLPWVLLLSAGLGLLAAVCLRICGKMKAGESLSFGPYLAAAGIVMLFALPQSC